MIESLAKYLLYSDEGAVTQKVMETDRAIYSLVCLKPGQAMKPFTHRHREAFVYCLEGAVRITPGAGDAELHAGDLGFYDGSEMAGPSNPGTENAAFLVTLVRKKDD